MPDNVLWLAIVGECVPKGALTSGDSQQSGEGNYQRDYWVAQNCVVEEATAGKTVYASWNAVATSKREPDCQGSTEVSNENKYNQRMSGKDEETKGWIHTAVK